MIRAIHRFHGRGSLRFVYQRGQTVRGSVVSLRYIRNERTGTYRVAVVVSRKVSKSAVVRNRIRRRIYEIVRKYADNIQGPYDLVFTVYSEKAADMSHATLQRALLEQLRESGAMQGPAQDMGRDTIPNVTDSNASGIHPPKHYANRKGEAVPTKLGRRKGKASSGFTPPSSEKETNG